MCEHPLSCVLEYVLDMPTCLFLSLVSALPFHRAFPFPPSSYVEYVLDVPMYFVYRNGTYHNAAGQSFRDFLEGKLPALPGGWDLGQGEHVLGRGNVCLGITFGSWC